MNKLEFSKKIGLINPIAEKYKWICMGTDFKTFRVSYKDELSIYRLDIYLSKMTVCLLPAGLKPSYFKRQNLEMVEAIFNKPHKYEIQ